MADEIKSIELKPRGKVITIHATRRLYNELQEISNYTGMSVADVCEFGILSLINWYHSDHFPTIKR